MKIDDLLSSMDAPALYFMRQTAELRAQCDALTIALLMAQELITDPDATPEDADRTAAIIRRTLETATGAAQNAN